MVDLAVIAIYSKAIANEKRITPVMCEVAKNVGGKMIGLEHRVKTPSSVKKKIERRAELGMNEEEALRSMNDLLRYTLQVDHDKIASSTDKIRVYLTQTGHTIREVDNKYISNTVYKGIHIIAITPEGQMYELQIHSKESLDVKNQIHPLYEEFRSVKTSPARRIMLERQMKTISQALREPKDIHTIQNLKGDV